MRSGKSGEGAAEGMPREIQLPVPVFVVQSTDCVQHALLMPDAVQPVPDTLQALLKPTREI